jgi:hypothetical protein
VTSFTGQIYQSNWGLSDPSQIREVSGGFTENAQGYLVDCTTGEQAAWDDAIFTWSPLTLATPVQQVFMITSTTVPAEGFQLSCAGPGSYLQGPAQQTWEGTTYYGVNAAIPTGYPFTLGRRRESGRVRVPALFRQRQSHPQLQRHHFGSERAGRRLHGWLSALVSASALRLR